MLADFIPLLLIVSAGTLYTLHAIKRFRALENKTRFTVPLHIIYIVAAVWMWIVPLLYSLAVLNTTVSTNMLTLRWIVGSVAIILLLIGIPLYLMEKRAQQSTK